MYHSLLCLVISFISGCTSSLTGEIEVSPPTVRARPGENVSLLCNSSMAITEVHWEINGEHADLSDVEVIGTHTMKLHIRNAGVANKYPPSTDVECMTNDGRRNGATMYVGYPPVITNLECMAQDLAKIHCRWSDFDGRIVGKPWLSHNARYKLEYRVGSGVGAGACEVQPNTVMFGVCQTVGDWDLHFKVQLTLKANNSLGSSNQSVLFQPHEHVMPSPPHLSISNHIDNNVPGVSLNVSVSSSSQFIREYSQCDFLIELEYGEIAEGVDTTHFLQKLREEDFWEDWSKWASVDHYWRPFPLTEKFTVTFSYNQLLQLDHLPARTKYLLRAKWKLNGDNNHFLNCNGTWSLYSSAIVTTKALKPPSFSDVAMLYFTGDSSFGIPLGSNHSVMDHSGKHLIDFSSVSLMWKLSDMDVRIHRNNHLHYEVAVRACSLPDVRNVSKATRRLTPSSRAVLPGQVVAENCALRVGCSNELGSHFSSWFRFSSNENMYMPHGVGPGCELTVLSMKLVKILSTKLRFKVSWALVPRTSTQTCDENIEESLNAGIFIWREDQVEHVHEPPQREKFHYSVKTFYLELDSTSTNSTKSEIHFDVKEYRNSTMQFVHTFKPHTAYRIAVALSLTERSSVIQGPATVQKNLYYFTAQRPAGAVTDVNCRNVTSSSMDVVWEAMNPSERNGPITGYLVYYTDNEKCFAGLSPQSTVCNGKYGKSVIFSEYCNKNDIQIARLVIKPNGLQSNQSDGPWMVEQSSNREISISLTDLDPATTYFVGVVPRNFAGEGNCFSHVVQTTLGARDAKIIYIPIILMMFSSVLLFALYRLRVFIKSHCGSPLPDPTIRISTAQDDEENVEFTAPEQTGNEKFESIDVPLHDNHNGPYQPRKAEKNFSNGGTTEKCLQNDYYNLSCENLTSIGLYLRNASLPSQVRSANSNEQDTTSLDSDAPCCSRSSTTDDARMSPSGASYGSDIEDDTAIYTSPEVALLFGGRARRLQIES